MREGESENRVRKRLIDTKLRASGWDIVPFQPRRPRFGYDRQAVTEFPTDHGPADYALFVDGVALGIVEAKRLTVDPRGVLSQAERYAIGLPRNPLTFGAFHVPFLYATNGESIWFHDVRNPGALSRKVARFHPPDALTELLGRDLDRDTAWLAQNPARPGALRPYQIEAIAAVEQAIRAHKRQLLVAMATGTGKTLTMVSQVYRLMKAGVARRVLFLVDRRALAAQAVRAFASFEAEPGRKFNQIYEVYSQRFQADDLDPNDRFDPRALPTSYLQNPRPGHAFVYICTIQRLSIDLFGPEVVGDLDEEESADADDEKLAIPSHAFDLIIADECHRGYTTGQISVWRNTLDHFDAIKVGLTATPAAHTKAYFNDVVFRYPYERAVREGYLVDYDAVTIASDVRLRGVFLREGEQVGRVDAETGAEHLDVLEDERHFDTTEVEQRVTAPDSNRKILEEVKRYALEHEARYGRFPKTLIFAVNDLPHTSHADQLVEIARDVFGRGEGFVQKITGRVDRPLQQIRRFRNRPAPSMVVTVDLLTTGIDIPDLEFIVFLRPVKSRILFEQMMGRGTRKGERYPDKSHFTIFDCFDGSLLEYFRQATSITAEPPAPSSRTIAQIIEEIYQNRDRDYHLRCLVKRLQRIDKEMSGDARDLFAWFISNGDLAAFAVDLPRRLGEDFVGTLAQLRDPAFQDLLRNYPRPKRTFLVAYQTEDEVGSRWLIRDGFGKPYQPDDYLAAFGRFIRENPARVEAIRILLDRPSDWGTDALGELKVKLQGAPERFTEDNLRKAHQACYHKSLVDLISMVKHAANQEQPLLTAEERVDRAFERLMDGRKFNYEQIRWLERIKASLVANLTIGREDFEDVPVLSGAGGWGKANGAFGGALPDLLQTINEAVAA